MEIRCPHCLVAFDSVGEVSWSNTVCPSCGENVSLFAAEKTSSYRPGIRVLGRFELLQEVGVGTFGSVWKARDTQLQRTVAVKIPRQRELNPTETELFLRDARAAAQLKHPRIASVHEVGRENETLYIVTDFIDGANLSEWLTTRQLTPDEAAELVIKIAEGLHHAHELGVVHRDVKPGNIMMDRNGEPYVIDFGLARREVGEMTMTAEGQVLGTPAYMPPEQARGEGHWADRRSDIYSLGVILFKLLTGELPFRGEARMLIVQILQEEPPSPRKLNASVPRDLETITLKCLEKDPVKRYATAGDLADDLKRYLAGEPIKARPVGRVERGWRWCKRHPDVASLSAVVLLMLIAVSIVAPAVAVHQSRLRRESELRRKELQSQVARNLFQRAGEEYDAGRIPGGIALLAAAYDLVDSDNPLRGSIRSLMSGWSNQAGRPLVNDSAILSVAFSPDGRTALVGGHDRAARLWDTTATVPLGKPLQHADSVRALAFSPDGRFALTGSQDRTAQMWDLESGLPFGKLLQHSHEVWAVAFSPDGTTLASGGMDRIARLWDARTGDSLGPPLQHKDNVFAVAFSPDSRWLLTGCRDGIARMWDIQSKQPLETAIQVGTPVYAVVFSPDGSKILTGSWDGTVRLWDALSLESLGEPLRHENAVYAAAWSPDGRTVLTGSFDNTARLWNARSGQLIGEPMRHGDWVMTVAFSTDGRAVLTGSADRTARLWNILSSRMVSRSGAINSASFSPDGRSLRGGGERIARLWESNALHFWTFLTAVSLSDPFQFDVSQTIIAASPDERRQLIRRSLDTARIWDVQTEQPIGEPLHHTPQIWSASFSANGRKVVTGGQDQHIRVWDAHSGKAIGNPIRHGGIVKAVTFSRDGMTILSGSSDQTARLWNSQTGVALGQPMQHPTEVWKVAFSPDGRLALTVCSDSSARLWDVASCEPVTRPMQYEISRNGAELKIEEGVFNADGTMILFRCADRTTRLYDVPQQLPDNRKLVRTWSRALSGFQVDEQGMLRQLSQAQWLEAQRELEVLQKH